MGPDRTPGGSSGGSAAAVAAGLAGAASATDGGGSIRIPAAFCGLFGLKPQRGRVPIEPHDHWNALSAAGCVTRTVADTALWLDVVDGRRRRPRRAAGRPSARSPTPRRRRPAELRIAISERPARAILPPIVSDDAEPASPRPRSCCARSATTSAATSPRFGLAGNNFVARYLGGIHDDVDGVPHPERLEARTRGFGRLGRAYPGGGRGPRDRAPRPPTPSEDQRAAGTRFDVLVTPTVGEPPVEVGRWEGKGALRTLLGMSRIFCFTPIWNHTGQPAAAVPAGFTPPGCRARSRWSAAPATSRPCSRSPPRSRPSAPGPTAARRSADHAA